MPHVFKFTVCQGTCLGVSSLQRVNAEFLVDDPDKSVLVFNKYFVKESKQIVSDQAVPLRAYTLYIMYIV